jgi:Transmembrane domain of unknown function (DUF3566)
MTERSAEQAPVQARPDRHETDRTDTTRIPLTERLQRRVGQSANGSNGSSSSRVLPPMPAEPREDQAPAAPAAEAPAPQARSAPPVPDSSAPEQTVAVPRPAPAPAPAETTTVTARRTPPAAARGPRRARLRLSRIDPWSVMKVSFLLSIAFGIVTVVSVFMVWSVLGAAGVWSSINNTVSDTVSSGNNVSDFDIRDYLGMSRVLGFTMLVSVIDVILITAIATLGAFLYNMAASLLGGIEVTLAEDS